MSVKSLPAVVLFLASGLLMSAAASASGVKTAKMNINFAQTYIFTQCPSTAPVGDICLSVTGDSYRPETGHLSFSRTAMVDPATFDGNHPTCLPIETSGTLTLPRGTLNIHAPGHVCFADGTASYDIIITGGTGAYAGALGDGKIVVPPPETDLTGRELWHLELFQSQSKGHRFP